MRKFSLLILLLGLWLCASTAAAQTEQCDKLQGEKAKLAKSLLDSQHPYSCCDETISKCLKKKKPCKIAIRLADSICRQVADNKNRAQIERNVSRRARSVMARKTYDIDLTGLEAAGENSGAVTVVVYACSRCPFCSKLIPKLYKEVTTGRLKGKVKLYMKNFPIKSHEYSKEGGLALTAATELGHFWDMANIMYKNFDMFCVDKLTEWAGIAGMDKEKFNTLMKDGRIRKQLIGSKKEGIVNKVEGTPTLFINGKKYLGSLNLDELVSVFEELHEQ